MRRLFRHSGVFPIGLDFNARGARLLQLGKSRGGYRLIAAAVAELDASASGLNEGAKFRTLLDTIHRRAESAGFSGHKCVISVQDSLLRVKSIRLPVMPANDIEKAIQLEAHERLGFGEETKAEIAWFRAGEVRQGDDAREEYLLLGVEQSKLEKIIDGVSAAGLQPIAVEPRFIAASRCTARDLRRESDSTVIRFVVNVGHLTTTVTILRGMNAVFYKRIEIGGRAMDLAAAERLRLDRITITDLRRKRMVANAYGQAVSDERIDRALFTAIRPLIEELAHEVSLCLRYHSVSFCGERPEKIVIIGSEAHEPGLVEAIHDTLHVPAEIGRPLDQVDLTAAPNFIEQGKSLAQWAVAAGLSLRGDASLNPAVEKVERPDRALARARKSDHPARKEAA